MTTDTLRASAPNFDGLASAISRAVSAIAAGSRASSDWRRLSAMTDAALAREGLTRDRIARAVFERNFR